MNELGMRLVMAVAVIGMIAAPVRGSNAGGAPKGTSFSVSFPAARGGAPLDGRVILLVSGDLAREPRAHVEPNEPLASPYIFGLNVDALAPGRAVVVDDKAFGWPARRLSERPPERI